MDYEMERKKYMKQMRGLGVKDEDPSRLVRKFVPKKATIRSRQLRVVSLGVGTFTRSRRSTTDIHWKARASRDKTAQKFDKKGSEK